MEQIKFVDTLTHLTYVQRSFPHSDKYLIVHISWN